MCHSLVSCRPPLGFQSSIASCMGRLTTVGFVWGDGDLSTQKTKQGVNLEPPAKKEHVDAINASYFHKVCSGVCSMDSFSIELKYSSTNMQNLFLHIPPEEFKVQQTSRIDSWMNVDRFLLSLECISA